MLIKRLMDLLISVVAILVFLPLFILISAVIKLDSKGPVLFRQKRVGKDEFVFEIYKFRTMQYRRSDKIDQFNEKVVSSNHDARITRVGKFLRNTSLDELPQLFNILLGDMSVVGPRPVLPEQLLAVPPRYRNRADVRPGLTGLSQVRGRRSLNWLLQLAYDLEYVRRRTLLLDIQIVFKTVWQVVCRRGIYGSPSTNWRGYLRQLNGNPPSDKDVEVALQNQKIGKDNGRA